MPLSIPSQACSIGSDIQPLHFFEVDFFGGQIHRSISRIKSFNHTPSAHAVHQFIHLDPGRLTLPMINRLQRDLRDGRLIQHTKFRICFTSYDFARVQNLHNAFVGRMDARGLGFASEIGEGLRWWWNALPAWHKTTPAVTGPTVQPPVMPMYISQPASQQQPSSVLPYQPLSVLGHPSIPPAPHPARKYYIQQYITIPQLRLQRQQQQRQQQQQQQRNQALEASFANWKNASDTLKAKKLHAKEQAELLSKRPVQHSGQIREVNPLQGVDPWRLGKKIASGPPAVDYGFEFDPFGKPPGSQPGNSWYANVNGGSSSNADSHPVDGQPGSSRHPNGYERPAAVSRPERPGLGNGDDRSWRGRSTTYAAPTPVRPTNSSGPHRSTILGPVQGTAGSQQEVYAGPQQQLYTAPQHQGYAGPQQQRAPPPTPLHVLAHRVRQQQEQDHASRVFQVRLLGFLPENPIPTRFQSDIDRVSTPELEAAEAEMAAHEERVRQQRERDREERVARLRWAEAANHLEAQNREVEAGYMEGEAPLPNPPPSPPKADSEPKTRKCEENCLCKHCTEPDEEVSGPRYSKPIAPPATESEPKTRKCEPNCLCTNCTQPDKSIPGSRYSNPIAPPSRDDEALNRAIARAAEEDSNRRYKAAMTGDLMGRELLPRPSPSPEATTRKPYIDEESVGDAEQGSSSQKPPLPFDVRILPFTNPKVKPSHPPPPPPGSSTFRVGMAQIPSAPSTSPTQPPALPLTHMTLDEYIRACFEGYAAGRAAFPPPRPIVHRGYQIYNPFTDPPSGAEAMAQGIAQNPRPWTGPLTLPAMPPPPPPARTPSDQPRSQTVASPGSSSTSGVGSSTPTASSAASPLSILVTDQRQTWPPVSPPASALPRPAALGPSRPHRLIGGGGFRNIDQNSDVRQQNGAAAQTQAPVPENDNDRDDPASHEAVARDADAPESGTAAAQDGDDDGANAGPEVNEGPLFSDPIENALFRALALRSLLAIRENMRRGHANATSSNQDNQTEDPKSE